VSQFEWVWFLGGRASRTIDFILRKRVMDHQATRQIRHTKWRGSHSGHSHPMGTHPSGVRGRRTIGAERPLTVRGIRLYWMMRLHSREARDGSQGRESLCQPNQGLGAPNPRRTVRTISETYAAIPNPTPSACSDEPLSEQS
jgi:hypothetical protein